MKPKIDWKSIKTVLLDMDGTLLDLYFDNYFWQEYLPEKWGEIQDIDAESAKSRLKEWYRNEAGTLSWYCLDFWTERLNFDVFKLKEDVEHLINIRPHAEEFLEQLSESSCRVIMVTNAHQKLVKMKMDKTGINKYFDEIVSAHDIGYAKEDQLFWEKLIEAYPFRKESTLLVDDNLTVLRAAKEFGIQHLCSIAKPDSHADEQDTKEFQSIESFKDVCLSSGFNE